jgi:hypothetical protein
MPERPIIGFVAGTPLMTAGGVKAIEEVKPGDTIQVQPNDDQVDGKHETQDEECWWGETKGSG